MVSGSGELTTCLLEIFGCPQIHGFYSEVSSLLLTRVKALYVESEVEGETLTKTFLNKYFNGSELLVAGKLINLNQTSLKVHVQATGSTGKCFCA